MKKRFFAALLCLCLLAGLAPNMGIILMRYWESFVE